MNIDLVVSVCPIILLLYLMTRKKNVPSHYALPLIALLMYCLKLIYFGSNFNLINATVINGLLTAWTPILIVWGAIFLFKTMEHSGGMEVVRTWLNGISDNSVAQLMIIGWAFSFLIEGASGFGTPAALAAPILVGLGFKPIKVVILCLIMNSVPVSFGAVGTPTWFGLGDLGLTHTQLLQIGFKTAIIHGFAALVIPLIALIFVVTWKEVRQNLLFIYLCIFSCIVPYIILAKFNYEFPSLFGGMVGLLCSVFFARKGIGLARSPDKQKSSQPSSSNRLAKALFPLWGTIVVLLLTRIKQLGLKGILVSATPSFDLRLGSLAEFSISPSLVVSLKNIFGTETVWTHKILYVPSIVPFFLVSLIAFKVFNLEKDTVRKIWTETYERMKKPILALLGALVFVKLLMVGGEQACTMIIGNSFANAIGSKWQYFTAYLGAVGAFFSGSNTVSNLTFGGIQDSIAQNLKLDRTTILSLQSVGGAMGNMICINNIIAVCSILGLTNKEGFILKKTVIPMLVYGFIAAVVASFL